MAKGPMPNRDGSQSRWADQKTATRRKRPKGARDLMTEGKIVTVGSAAERAGLSLATACRQFSEPETLRIEAGPELDMGSAGNLLDLFEAEAAGITDIADRAAIARRQMVRFMRRNLAAYRMFIAKGREQAVPARGARSTSPRGGRRGPLPERAIEPQRRALGPVRARALVEALMATSGPDPDFVLRDVGRLSDDAIDRVCEQNLRDLVAAHPARAGFAPEAGGSAGNCTPGP